ncbi:Arginine N-succinyltransferase [Poriferisphaera corsica]|uniref:Arginine N-succinyltransferase n=1 Tax=Poriferisphaera corsica TaxID=2528020 RepID=A0A517YYZ3_9BACT|nr:arginine N-succinyltransferase [Poriferisphaera corsica]QDU35450.1 Arginine N-succinyltransferase [Poriferisphaera corsica]
MHIIRPITKNDGEAVLKLASQAGYGFTSLLPQKSYIHERIEASIHGKNLLFVLEDLSSNTVIGTSAIKPSAGKPKKPFYSFRIETAFRKSETLGVNHAVRTLHLYPQFKGPTELGSLMILQQHRNSRIGLGRLASLSRFLYIAESPSHFNHNIVAEIRGFSDAHGHSPFWDAIGKHFFKTDFVSADRLSAIDKQFIADLMPIYPIYIPLLPQTARNVIAKPHPQALPAQKMLLSEGFRFIDLVDIFDAGPSMQASRDTIRTVRESAHFTIKDIAPVSSPELLGRHLDQPDSPRKNNTLIIATFTPTFIATLTQAQIIKGKRGIRIPLETAQALNIDIGDTVRLAPIYPAPSNLLLDAHPPTI